MILKKQVKTNQQELFRQLEKWETFSGKVGEKNINSISLKIVIVKEKLIYILNYLKIKKESNK